MTLQEDKRVPRTLDALTALVLVLVASAAALYGASHSLPQTLAYSDYTPIYCAGRLTHEHLDPNLTAPLEACEDSVSAEFGVAPPPPGAVNPAPLPGYDLAIFGLLSFLPYRIAATLWAALIVIAMLWSVTVLHRLTGLPRTVIAAALIGTEIVACLVYGQIAPFAILALAYAGLYLSRGDPRTAAFAALGTLVQPQVGAAVVLAMFIFAPRARLTLLAGCVALGLLSVAYVGVSGVLAYARVVLPQQGAAEVPFRIQYSLTWLLYAAGLDESRALQIGAWDYALTSLVSVALAGRIAKALNAPEALVTFPAACVMLGGTYVHQFQLSAAVPFALVLVARAPQFGALAWSALLLLAIPWQDLAARSGIALGALAIVVIVWTAWRQRAIAVRSVATLVVLGLFLAFPRFVSALPAGDLRAPPTPASFAQRGFDPALATAQHGLFVRSQPGWTASSWQVVALKIPLWAGLACLVLAGLLAASRRRPAATLQNSQGIPG